MQRWGERRNEYRSDNMRAQENGKGDPYQITEELQSTNHSRKTDTLTEKNITESRISVVVTETDVMIEPEEQQQQQDRSQRQQAGRHPTLLASHSTTLQLHSLLRE